MMFISVGVCQKFEVFVQKSWVFLFLYKILLCSVKLNENKKVLPWFSHEGILGVDDPLRKKKKKYL